MALLAIEREICFNPICPLTFDYRLLAMAVLQPYSKESLFAPGPTSGGKSMLKSRVITLSLELTLLISLKAPAQTAEHYVVLDGVTSQARVLNASDNTQIAAIQAATTANAIAISPNGRRAFVAGLNGQFVSVIDLSIQAEIKRIRGIR